MADKVTADDIPAEELYVVIWKYPFCQRVTFPTVNAAYNYVKIIVKDKPYRMYRYVLDKTGENPEGNP